MEADLTETAIIQGSDENGLVRIGVLALVILAEAERARRVRAERTERPKPLGLVSGEPPKEGNGRGSNPRIAVFFEGATECRGKEGADSEVEAKSNGEDHLMCSPSSVGSSSGGGSR